MTYYSSPEKDAVRSYFETPLIRHLRKRKGRRLSYFGLPGEEARDIVDWSSELEYVAAVENRPKLLRNLESVLEQRFPHIQRTTHLGDADAVIRNDVGKRRMIFGQLHQPRVSRFDKEAGEQAWHFDVVNLDYFGQFLPRVPGNAKGERLKARNRTLALKQLFERNRVDAWRPWLLLITVEAEQARQSSEEHKTYLQECKRNASQREKSAIDFLCSEGPTQMETATRLIMGTAALLLSAPATAAGLSAQTRGAVMYHGSDDQPMVHLAFEFAPLKGALPARVSSLDLLRTPLLETLNPLEKPWLGLSANQVPGMTKELIQQSLSFIPATGRNAILNA